MTAGVQTGQSPRSASARAHARSTWQTVSALQQRLPVLQAAAVLAAFTWGAIQVPGFAGRTAIVSTLVLASLLGLASIGQTLVVLIGGLDLAVPGYIAVGAVMAAQLAGKYQWPLAATAVLAVVVCSLAGAVSGWICQHFRVEPLVVTLGTYSILVSGILILTNANIVDAPPAALTNWTSVGGTTLGLPVPAVVVGWLVMSAVVGVVLARTRPGRHLYASGANPRAAALMKINTGRIWITVFALSGALSALAGMLIAGFASGATPATGDPYLFSGLAAVIVGGTTLGTARGSYTRTMLGALFLTELTTILAGQGFDEGDNQILFGVVILIVVASYGRQRRLNDRV